MWGLIKSSSTHGINHEKGDISHMGEVTHGHLGARNIDQHPCAKVGLGHGECKWVSRDMGVSFYYVPVELHNKRVA